MFTFALSLLSLKFERYMRVLKIDLKKKTDD